MVAEKVEGNHGTYWAPYCLFHVVACSVYRCTESKLRSDKGAVGP